MALPSWNAQQILNQLQSDTVWTSPTVSYSFPTNGKLMVGSVEKKNFTALNAAQQEKAELALDLWDEVANIDFIKASGNQADIDFGFASKGIEYAHAYSPDHASIWFGKSHDDLRNPVIGDHGFYTYVHEVGHALGLDHMGDYNGEGDWTPSSFQDSTVFTVMSYFGPSTGDGAENGEGLVAWADWYGSDGNLYAPQTLMLNDIMAIQDLYGAETTTRTDNTVYGFNATVDSYIYDFTQNQNPILCLYDSAGVDTLDLSGWSTTCSINLTPGSFSSANDMTSNISIAYGANIENAVGGDGDDTITGNGLANRLQGNGGNDVILGGAGADTAIFAGKFSDYEKSYDAVAKMMLVSSEAEGVDTLKDVEFFQFSDGVRTLEQMKLADDDGISFARLELQQAELSEGNAGSGATFNFKIILDSAVETAQSLNYVISGLDTSAGDLAGPAAGKITFAAGQSEASLKIKVVGDADFEANEKFNVTLSNASSGLIIADAEATATIMNDDAPPQIINGNKKNNVLNGSSTADEIFGFSGKDTLNGNAGKDIINGGTGNDRLTGGADADVFQFTNKTFGKDIITDFVDGVDLLQFSLNIADSFSDFKIRGNDSASVTVSLGKNSVVINGQGPIHIDADDFLFG